MIYSDIIFNFKYLSRKSKSGIPYPAKEHMEGESKMLIVATSHGVLKGTRKKALTLSFFKKKTIWLMAKSNTGSMVYKAS